jgi:hypothetical protein
VDYDIEKAVQRIVDAGIPEENAWRLRERGVKRPPWLLLRKSWRIVDSARRPDRS